MRKTLWAVGIVYAAFGVWAHGQETSYTSIQPATTTHKTALSNPMSQLDGFETTVVTWTFINSNHHDEIVLSDGTSTYRIKYDEAFTHAVDRLQTNNVVTLSYYTNDHGQYVLATISVQ